MQDSGTEPITLAIVEDEDLYRDLLRVVLSQQTRLEVVGAFPDAESALAAIPDLGPRVVLLDIELPGLLNGVQLGKRLRHALPEVGVVLLSNHGDPQFIASLPQEVIGGWSYLLKKSVSDVNALNRAIEGAAAGFVVLDPQLVTRMSHREEGALARLPPRQRQILALMAQGYTNAAIARELVLAEKTVENQINLIYQQLDFDREDPSIQPRAMAVRIYLKESMYDHNAAPDRGVAAS
jgi:DNA-binding NarL/FixJ family response regulator